MTLYDCHRRYVMSASLSTSLKKHATRIANSLLSCSLTFNLSRFNWLFSASEPDQPPSASFSFISFSALLMASLNTAHCDAASNISLSCLKHVKHFQSSIRLLLHESSPHPFHLPFPIDLELSMLPFLVQANNTSDMVTLTSRNDRLHFLFPLI